ncbi:hypothetical protein [Chitinophaga nivalis]|uniref:Uncharacterized protein n=1 Tax=Chitinophaga nivalis TaxID=2991709 RepID=A0ABT3IKU3_9BACT|nr:hypothetical protein [Chitinophaga nivalis]MCW3465731.1 hypothetical protein [Chitinophaga nivalis]MCW3484578.1 hypothetical protein [Chitinophaga nivalis]
MTGSTLLPLTTQEIQALQQLKREMFRGFVLLLMVTLAFAAFFIRVLAELFTPHFTADGYLILAFCAFITGMGSFTAHGQYCKIQLLRKDLQEGHKIWIQQKILRLQLPQGAVRTSAFSLLELPGFSWQINYVRGALQQINRIAELQPGDMVTLEVTPHYSIALLLRKETI